MRLFLAMMFALVFSTTPAAADPNGVRVNPNIILEPITEVPLIEAFRTAEFVHGGGGVLGVWRFSYEEGAYDDGDWQAIGLIGVSALGEGIEPVIVRVWARGEITSGDSEGLIAAPLSSPSADIASAFRVGLTRTRGAATITIDQRGVVEVNDQRLGVTSYE